MICRKWLQPNCPHSAWTISREHLRESEHVEEVCPAKAGTEFRGQLFTHCVDNLFAVVGALLLEDVSMDAVANLPVELDQRGVHGACDVLPGVSNQRPQFPEQWRGRDYSDGFHCCRFRLCRGFGQFGHDGETMPNGQTRASFVAGVDAAAKPASGGIINGRGGGTRSLWSCKRRPRRAARSVRANVFGRGGGGVLPRL